jgi:V8-like Glu-specific endopeptidase
VFNGLVAESLIALREVVRATGAPWLQLHFSDYNLGKLSYIIITSLEDGGHQLLNAKSLAHSQNSSVYFNGDTVEVALHVAPGEKDIFFRIEEITVGEWVGLERDSSNDGLCGDDTRVSSTDPRVGRIMPGGCTGWIISNGAILTAGHCAGGGVNMALLEFNVPPSDCDGTINNPSSEDRYFIDQTSIVFSQVNFGNDWAVFKCKPDAVTGLLPVQAQGAFYRVSLDENPTNVRVTGYGTDNTPTGCTSNFNSDSQTQQTDSGPFLREMVQNPSDVYIEYAADSTLGLSGAPVINLSNDITIGIHNGTVERCNPPGSGNRGTSFKNDSLANAIQTFPGANVVYVDKEHPVVQEDGTIFRPYDTVTEGVNSVPSDGIVSIVIGSYNETITITKALTMVAPVGTVIIGK